MRLAIIGCGAVTELGHLPALRDAEVFDVVALVDRNEARAKSLVGKFQVPHVFTDFAQALPEVDAAIIALPHHLHAPVSLAFLDMGKHVLVEKPMGINANQCRGMAAAAERSGVCLAVGHMRRFFPGLQLAKQWLDRGLVGTIKRFDFQDGFDVSGWPAASNFIFQKETAGGGVLLDTGAHVLDILHWFLGDVAGFSYKDDNHGGVEADCFIDLTLRSTAKGIVELSRTRKLRNSAIIEGEEGTIEVFFHQSRLILRPSAGKAFSIDARHADSALAPGLVQMLSDQLLNWHAAIIAGRKPAVSGADGLRVVTLIEEMYRQREPLAFPWEGA